jgi:hypothetical protein
MVDLFALAQRIADAIPEAIAEEIVLTGSVSCGVADEVSDIEMLLVTAAPLTLEDGFALARAAGLERLGTWGAQAGPSRSVSGRREGVPIELIWWPRAYAAAQIDRLLEGAMPSTADALAHGVALRTTGLLAAWQVRLAVYPPELAAAQVEQAALPWGGFAAAGVLTLVRPGDRLALVEWMLDCAIRVLEIVYAINGVWRPTTKRRGARVDARRHARPARRADRGRTDRAGPAARAARHDRAAARRRPARAERAQRRPGPLVACGGAGVAQRVRRSVALQARSSVQAGVIPGTSVQSWATGSFAKTSFSLRRVPRGSGATAVDWSTNQSPPVPHEKYSWAYESVHAGVPVCSGSSGPMRTLHPPPGAGVAWSEPRVRYVDSALQVYETSVGGEAAKSMYTPPPLETTCICSGTETDVAARRFSATARRREPGAIAHSKCCDE